jgi:hypothetical protein
MVHGADLQFDESVLFDRRHPLIRVGFDLPSRALTSISQIDAADTKVCSARSMVLRAAALSPMLSVTAFIALAY